MGDVLWYEAPRERLAQEVFATADAVRNEQYQQRRLTLHFFDLFTDGNPSGLGQRALPTGLIQFFRGSPVGNLPGSHFALCRAVVDTAASMVAQQSPLPIVITSGTKLSIARRAEKKTKVLQSQMNELKRGGVFTRAFDFCAQTGTGVVHDYVGDDGLVKLEAVNPLEILVDHLDGLYRNPRSIHRYRYMSKQAAKELWPGNDEVIDKSGCGVIDVISAYLMPSGYGSYDDMVEVIESWALPRGKSKGRRSVCVSGGALIDQRWEDTGFPFSFVRYRVRPFGFWGSGLIESVRPNQERINTLIRKVARAQDLASNVYIFSPDDGENAVNPNFITTKIATIIPYKPDIGAPQLVKWDGTLGDLQQQIDLEFERVLRVEGLSEQQVSGEGAGKGLTSGVAVRAADDVQSRRLFHPTDRFEEMCLAVAERVAKRNDELAAKDKSYAPRGFVTQAGINFLMSSEWAELEIPEGESCINMMRQSALPTTPAGRWAAIQEWVQAGFITKPTALKLLQFPMLDEVAALETAQLDLIWHQLTDLLDGIPVQPLPRQPMNLVLDVGTKAWAQMMRMQPDPEVIDAFEEYLDLAKAWLDKQAAEQQAAAANQQAAEGAGSALGAPQGGLTATDLTGQVAA